MATYVGDIPLYVDLKLNDLERVEVLLGPQGTLYGAGTMGGAIRYIPKKPDVEAFDLEVRGNVYTYDSEGDDAGTDIGGTINIPMGDTFALRANLDYVNDPGFIDYNYLVREVGVSNPDPDFSDADDVGANIKSEEDANDEETLGGRVSLRWTPNDIIDANLTYYYQKVESGGADDQPQRRAQHRRLRVRDASAGAQRPGKPAHCAGSHRGSGICRADIGPPATPNTKRKVSVIKRIC